MAPRKALIIGAGLGGLQCAHILSRNGFEVTVLEQCAQAGGCLQTFRRKGMTFDTGFHYVGGLGKGEALEWLFDYFDLMDLPWVKMDTDCVDEIDIGERRFRLASGFDNFERIIIEQFPSQKEGISHFRQTVESICNSTRERILNGEAPSEFAVGAYEFICSCVSDPTLRQVLAGASLRLHTEAATLSLYEYAQIYGSFIQSGWRLDGGGSLIAEKLARNIAVMGGKILTSTRVVALRSENGDIREVLTEDGQSYKADIYISDIHPAVTLSLLDDPTVVRKTYRQRIENARDSFGIFTVNIALKPGKILCPGHNIHIHTEGTDIWHQRPGAMESFLVSFYPSRSGKFAEGLDILTSVDPSMFCDCGGAPMHRNGSYTKTKNDLAARCIEAVSRRLPQLRDAIDEVYTSTPRTYEDYTSTRGGSAFGIKKDCSNPLLTLVSPRTPLHNLFLTGQNLNLHGMLGVSMTSLLTCREILGESFIKKEFKRTTI